LSQSFEGVLTYSVEFDIKGSLAQLKEQILAKMKRDGEYFDTLSVFIKGGNYLKQDNREEAISIIYRKDLAEIYNFQEDFEYVTIVDASRQHLMGKDFGDPELTEEDTRKEILGFECSLLKLSWPKLGEELYYYNSDVASLDPDLFKSHNFEYLNVILEHTNSYPLEIIKSINEMISIKMILVSIEPKSIDSNKFQIPELENAEDDYANIIKRTTGNLVMKIKN
jgi:hypothetical protein